MFAHARIEFLHFHLVWLCALVLGRGVVVTRTGTGNQFNFFSNSHCLTLLDLDAAGTNINKNGIDALFVDRTQTVVRYAQAHPTILALHPNTAVMQIG